MNSRMINRPHRGIYAACYGVASLLLAWLIVINSRFTLALDHDIQSWLLPITNPHMTKIVVVLTSIGSPAIAISLCTLVCIILWILHERKDFWWSVCLLVGGNLLNFLVKNIVHRARPADKLVPQAGYSFPSGHTFGTGILIMIVLAFFVARIKNKPLRITLETLGYVWIVIIALTRIYLHVHYPTDTIGAGLLVGFVWNTALIGYRKYIH